MAMMPLINNLILNQMLNHSKQQQSVILKGVAQQLLTMQMPTFDEVDKLLMPFDIHIMTQRDMIRNGIFQTLAQAPEKAMVYFCYGFMLPTGETKYHVEPMSWETRNPDLIEKLIEMDYEANEKAATWDPEMVPFWGTDRWFPELNK